MTISNGELSLLDDWLDAKESEHLEFKEAKNNFHFGKLVKYCAALANEGGGSLVLGVSDQRPRKVVGSQAFANLERTKAGLIEKLRLRVDVRELNHPNGRVVVFTSPPHPLGVPVEVEGAYWMRAGEDLAPMTPDMLRRIFEEAGPDFSAEICPGATLSDLDPDAMEQFRSRWHRRSGNPSLLQLSPERLLRDGELMTETGITYAALILMGTHESLGRHLAQSEVVFEYRSSEAAGPASQREEFRRGFLHYYDRLWEVINLRNDRQHFQDGLFMMDVLTFSESAVREAVLNAVAHRDYRHAGSVFIRQFPRRIEIVSPGGFPQGITPENILDRQLPRNRRIADAFAKCGLVERAGQGANRIFESCIREGKPLPDFTHTDAHQVSLTLHGQVQDPSFVRFLERIARETATGFDTHDFVLLDLIHREATIPDLLKPRLRRLLELGIVESVGRGRGARYLLSRRFYVMTARAGTYTRRRGLDRETNKELILKHLRENPGGSPISDLQQVLPGLSRANIQRLLGELRRDGLARLVGERRGARWFPDSGNAQ
jgi:ATP-dependent DNA helicase RecG